MPSQVYFSHSYRQARERFAQSAQPLASMYASYALPQTGQEGEVLATDVALIARPGANRLLIITSATHGVEGFCGSAGQLALLNDAPMLARAYQDGVALLLVHAVNPYGFSWLSRGDEDNVDLNRNAQPFDGQPLPGNPGYAALHNLLIPDHWPPSEDNEQAIARYKSRHGSLAYAQAVSKGQYDFPGGLFFGGQKPAASRLTMQKILAEHANGFEQIGWIDVHTGLGPRGHGEKIFAGRRDEAEVARALKWWGSDIAVPYKGSSASVDVTGHLASTIYAACPDSVHTLMALEFGTVSFDEIILALRGRSWLLAHPDADPTLRVKILQATLDAFYCNQPDWQGMVLGQSRVAILQGILGLAEA